MCFDFLSLRYQISEKHEPNHLNITLHRHNIDKEKSTRELKQEKQTKKKQTNKQNKQTNKQTNKTNKQIPPWRFAPH